MKRPRSTNESWSCCKLWCTIKQLPPGWSFLADQLRRSSSSIGLNFAEGYYQPSSKQVRRYFVYAIQSARETSMALDIAGAFDLAPADQVRRGKGLCLEIVKMMSKLGQLSRKPAG